MASYQAIETVCETVIQLLRSNYRFEDFNTNLQFAVYLWEEFGKPMDTGVSLLVYRVFINGNHRTPAGYLGPNGQRNQTRLPLDIHFLLTVWAKKSSMQNRIAGWMMRVMEDNPILPVGLLDAAAEGVFRPDETVELIPGEIRTEDLLRLWEILAPNKYHLTIPYIARNLRIESEQPLTSGEPVQTRVMDYRRAG